MQSFIAIKFFFRRGAGGQGPGAGGWVFRVGVPGCRGLWKTRGLSLGISGVIFALGGNYCQNTVKVKTQYIRLFFFLSTRAGGILRILHSDWFLEQAEISYL